MFSIGVDDDGFPSARFVFVVGAVARFLGFFRALVLVGDGMTQFRFQTGSFR